MLHDGHTHVGCEELERKAVEGECRPRVWGVGHIHGECEREAEGWQGTRESWDRPS